MKNFTETFVATLKARNEIAPSKDITAAINNATRYSAALDQLFGSKAFHAVAGRLIKRCEIAHKNQGQKDEFIAVKVLVKIVGAAVAMSQRNTSTLDPYSKVIVTNLCELNSMSTKDNLVSLSKSVSYSELDQAKHIVKHYNCSPSTASTQASSTRMMLEALNICDVIKAKRNDEIAFKDNECAVYMRALFEKDQKEALKATEKKTARKGKTLKEEQDEQAQAKAQADAELNAVIEQVAAQQ